MVLSLFRLNNSKLTGTICRDAEMVFQLPEHYFTWHCFITGQLTLIYWASDTGNPPSLKSSFSTTHSPRFFILLLHTRYFILIGSSFANSLFLNQTSQCGEDFIFFFSFPSFLIPWLDYQLYADSQYCISSLPFSPELQTVSICSSDITTQMPSRHVKLTFSKTELLISFSNTIYTCFSPVFISVNAPPYPWFLLYLPHLTHHQNLFCLPTKRNLDLFSPSPPHTLELAAYRLSLDLSSSLLMTLDSGLPLCPPTIQSFLQTAADGIFSDI